MDALVSGIVSLIYGVVTGVIANAIFWSISIFVVGILLAKRRRHIHRFFGIRKGEPLVVYLSTIFVEPSVAITDRFNASGNRTGLGDRGFLLAGYESQVIPMVARAFSPTRLDLLTTFVETRWVPKQPNLEFLPSPQDSDEEQDIMFAPTISVGGPRFNSITHYYLRTSNPYYRFTCRADQWHVEIARGREEGTILTESLDPTECDYGLILRLSDTEHNDNTVFIVAGIEVNGTRAAAEFLFHNWARLLEVHGTREFGICIKCPSFDADRAGYLRPEIVHELPRALTRPSKSMGHFDE
jgi:hypothetical protein